MIYFIQSGNSGPIKIGYTANNDMEKRLRALQTGAWDKLVVLGTTLGTISDEHRIHKRFKEFRLNGEWFRPCERLLSFIPELLKANENKINEQLSQIAQEPNDEELLGILQQWPMQKIVEEVEARCISTLLKHTHNNKRAAAKLLGISRSTLYAKMKLYDCTL